MKPKKNVKEEGEHEVNVTITIAKCSPTVEKDPDPKRADLVQVQNYFHCQYKLLPEDKDYVRADVVTFGEAAKLYADGETKVLRVWLEGGFTWVAWTSTRRLRVTQDSLLKMFKHKCELKFWDSKDKVSAKARFDRPKAFRLPATKSADEVDLDNVRSLLQLEGKINRLLGSLSLVSDRHKTSRFHGPGIMSQSTINPESSTESTSNSKKVNFDESREKHLQTKRSSNDHFISATDSKIDVKVRVDKNNNPEFKNLLSLASSGAKPLPVDTEETEEINVKPRQEAFNSNRSKGRKKNAKNDIYSSLMNKDALTSEHIHKNGLSSVSVQLKRLFTTSRSVSCCMPKRMGTVEELIMILTLDSPLLSDIQADSLNPMTLTVGSAMEMPNNGMSFEELSLKCIPPYIKYKFLDSNEFVSAKKKHQKDLVYNEYDVVLLGTMSKELLQEYLLGPPLKIEIHDRDPKQDLKERSGIFGTHKDDEHISSITFSSNSVHNGGYDEPFSVHCGIAEFDLSELLRGERLLTLVSPIRNLTRSSDNKSPDKVAKIKGFSIPPGDYLGRGSELKIKVELSRSLIKKMTLDSTHQLVSPLNMNPRLSECPFSRMVYVFDYKNKKFLKEIIGEITQINATSLNLLSYPPEVIAAALSTYKLTDEQKDDKLLDIITGCQIIDGVYHVFIVEGLTNLGIKKLWDKLDHPECTEDSHFRILYNSSLTFSKRIFLSLDVDLTRVRLHQPLRDIVQQPLLYVRDILPRKCFQAVTKLFQLTQCTSLHNAIRNEMLPTADMIISLSKEFGVPLTDEDFTEGDSNENTRLKNESDLYMPECNENVYSKKTKLRAIPLDMENEAYEKLLEERKDKPEKDYICSNVKYLLSLSKKKDPTPGIACNNIEVAHNYSSQSLNSTEMAKEKLRHLMSSDPNSRFTYCHEYNSATVVPVSREKVAKENEEKSRDEWKTSNGFIFPGFKSALESNAQPIPIDLARKDELSLPWRENILHRNILKPSVDRIYFNYEDRGLDFDTLSTPPNFFGKPAPVTIHAAGDTLANEKLNAKMKDLMKWRDKLVVDDTEFKTHRCLIATELTDQGAKSSNQHARLQDLLKSEPQKFALKHPGLTLSPIPALSVVSYPNVESKRRDNTHPNDPVVNASTKNVGFHPGEEEGKSWSQDINTIPIKDYNHSYFEKLNGKDFRFVQTDKERVLPKIKPLEEADVKNHLFSMA